MYRNLKKTLAGICDTLHEIHDALPGIDSPEEKAALLDAAQQGAIKIGECLEAEDKEKYAGAVGRLEEYCEKIFRLSQAEEISEEELEEAELITDETQSLIAAIRPRLKVVFFPYKAEMWDSLESFYLAAREDPDCDAYLVPIPYFEFDKNGGAPMGHYDIDRFPKDEDPIPFDRFDHTDGSIDIAYIHNPYDDHNHITTIHPHYYSGELKKYVGKLIYTPYFVTNGSFSDDQMNLPVYQNMDYMIIQSEDAKKCCEGVYYYDRILPFGSSKLDMVINKCRRGVDMPEEWKKIIGNRRTLMLNSSINDLLRGNRAVLDKLEYFFRLVKKNDRIAVIWRPHPLYESTMRAMRPEFLPQYEEIKKKFIEERIGVFDTNPDISDTIAIADGYIGSGASSVINMFAAAGRPAFIFDNSIREPVGDEDRRVMRLSGADYFRDRLYMNCLDINAIFSVPLSDLSAPLKYEGSIPGANGWPSPLRGLSRLGKKLYMAPLYYGDAVSFDPVMRQVETLGSVGRQYNARYASVAFSIPSRKSALMIPSNNKYLIMEYVPGKDEWIYHQEGPFRLYEGVERPDIIPMLFGGTRYDDCFYYSTGICNRVLKIISGTGKYELLYLIKKELDTGLNLVLKGGSKEGLWYSFGGSSDIYLAPWESLDDGSTHRVYHMPDDLVFAHDDFGDPAGLVGGMADFGRYMVMAPYKTAHLIRIEKETGAVDLLAEEFFKDSDKKGIGYDPGRMSVVRFSFLMGEDRIGYQLSRDLRVAIINVNDGSFEEFEPRLPDEIFDRLVPEDAGFYKGDKYDYFRMQESRLFSLEHFLDVFARDGYKEVRKEQIAALSTLAADLEGTCGIKTHAYLKKIIEEEG